jgi:hypothetical protein
VLSVGVDLQGMRAAGGVGSPESFEHRDALAPIDRAADHLEPGGFKVRDPGEYGRATGVAAIVDEPAFVSMGLERRDGRGNRALVVIEGNDQAQAHHR